MNQKETKDKEMTMLQHLQAKYKAHAQTLGDIEFQIYILNKKRDELRQTMQELDRAAPELQSVEKEIAKSVSDVIKQGMEKRDLNAQNKKEEGKV